VISLSKSAVIRLSASLVGALGLIALLWLVGPLFGLDGAAVLAGGSVLILALWGLGNFLVSWRAAATDSSLISALVADGGDRGSGTAAASAEEVQALGEKLQDALTLLKKTGNGKSGQGETLYTLPWYLIVGPPGSGKTTALLNSGLHFPLADRVGRKPVKGIGGTRNCDWWFTDEAVLLDTAGRYTTQDSRQAVDQAGWLGFLDLLKTYRGRQPVNGVLVAISLSDLATLGAEERAVHAAAIKARLRELHEYLGVRFPVYVLFTKTDLIAGFVEFFEDLGREEREQVLGMTFPLDDESRPEGAVADFATEFDGLVGRMNDRLIDRVHQERDIRRRALIFGFPGQFASMKEVAGQFLTEIFQPSRYDPRLLLRGVYFTSGTQEGTPIDRLLGSMAAAFGLSRPVSSPFGGASRSYFLTRLLREVVFGEASMVGVDPRTEHRRLWLRRGAYAGLALALVGGAGLWGASFFSNERLISAVAAGADAYGGEIKDKPFAESKVADDDIKDVLPLLNRLRGLPAGDNDQRAGHAAALGLGLYQGRELGEADEVAYRRALVGIFLPRLLVHLGNQMRDDLDKPVPLRDALKAFLILGSQGPMDRAFVAAQFRPVWDSLFPGAGHETERGQLAAHLEALLAEALPAERPQPVDVGEPLIVAARRVLAQETPAAGAWRRIAESRELNKALPDWRLTDHVDGNLDSVFVRTSNKRLTDGLPGRFTAAGFSVVVPAILAQAKATRDESWVTGQAPDDGAYADLDHAIVQLYLNDYAEAWDGLLKDLTIKSPESPKQSAAIVAQLSGTSSLLVKVLDAVRAETVLAPPAPPGGAVVASLVAPWLPPLVTDFNARFKAVNALTQDPGGKSPELAAVLEALKAAIGPLEAFAQAEHGVVLGSTDPAAEAGAARRRLASEASLLPPPVQGWLQAITQGSAAQSAVGLRAQLDSAWKADVLPRCKLSEGHYPFAGAGAPDMAMDDFARLFAPGGQFDAFFNTRLAHYVDAAARPWRWQSVDNTALGIPPGVLTAFERAGTIRDGFFPDGGRVPSARFELRATGFGPQTQEVAVDVDGQQFTFQRTGTQAASMVWPNPAGPREAWVTFTAIPTPSPGASATATAAGAGTATPAPAVPVAPAVPALRVGQNGPWAWARLLQGRMQGGGDRFTLTLAAGSGPTAQRITLEMRASSVVNPFSVLAEMKDFRCPPSF
jgi:type VI secretion system protein ImpL